MEENDRARLIDLVNQLDKYRDAYYNDNESLISDHEYDDLYDEIVELEVKTGLILSNSPTQTVGYTIKSSLDRVTHTWPPMLSLDKTKEISKIRTFLKGNYALVMAKLDGLTCRLTYNDGKLMRAETRGNGIEGEDITHNAPVIKGIPLFIPNIEGEYIIDGEIIVTRSNFNRLKAKFKDEKGKEYKNARNFASGSARLHSNEECAARNLEFIAWKFVKGYHFKHFASNLNELTYFGFNITPFYEIKAWADDLIFECTIENIKSVSNHYDYPIDGCVFGFDEMSLVEQFDYTAHHWKAQMAYKFYDDTYETKIRNIRWTIGKTGALTPTALFDPVEIDGTEIKKASIHNITILKNLNVRKDCTAHVFKANMIIPQIDHCENDGVADFEIPNYCPYCGAPTRIIKEKDSEVLICSDSFCKGILLSRLTVFVSKEGMDIDGLSKGILKTLIDLGIVENYTDIFNLWLHETRLKELPGFGEISVNKLFEAIEKSRSCKLENYLYAFSIPGVGITTAKDISNYFNGNIYSFIEFMEHGNSFTQIEGIGVAVSRDIYKWFDDFQNNDQFMELLDMDIRIIRPSKVKTTNTSTNRINGKTFCITGTFERAPRSELQKTLESLGGIFVSSVSKKTDILFVGDKAGSKLDKAQSLGITIITEENIDTYLTGEMNA